METTAQFGYIGNRRRELRPQPRSYEVPATERRLSELEDLQQRVATLERLVDVLSQRVVESATQQATYPEPEPEPEPVEDSDTDDAPSLTLEQQEELQNILNASE